MAQLTLGHLTEAGSALVLQGKPDLAVSFFELAVATAPRDPACWAGLGQALRVSRRFDEAINTLERAISIEVTPRRLVSLACCYTDQERFAEAEPFILRALELDPDCPEAKGLLGMISVDLWHQGRPDSTLERALVLLREAELDGGENPSFGPARVAALQILGRVDEAIETADRHLNKWPDNPETHVNRSWCCLQQGRLREGFREYTDWVYSLRAVKDAPVLKFPLWDRDAKPGLVTVWNAEGYGDWFMFARFFDRLADEGWTVQVIADQNLAGIIAGCAGVDRIFTEDGRELVTDCQAPLFHLPAAYVEDVQLWSGPYLSAEEYVVDKWSNYFAKIESDHGKALRVGLSWQGNPKQGNDPRRSFVANSFRPLFNLFGVRFFGLQKGQDYFSVPIAINQLPGVYYEAGDWLETAAVIQNLDLVITSDTAIAHLAGAMGKPVWMALGEPGCWRWQRDRDDSPWYPSMRIFRQSIRGIWTDVFERMASELSGVSSSRLDRDHSLVGAEIA